MTEQPRVTEAQAISPAARSLAQQLGETKFHVLHSSSAASWCWARPPSTSCCAKPSRSSRATAC